MAEEVLYTSKVKVERIKGIPAAGLCPGWGRANLLQYAYLIHADFCLVARSIRDCIEIKIELEIN